MLDGLSPKELIALSYDWPIWARADQLAPAGDWRIWALLAGRGYGKTRLGAEFVRSQVENGNAKRIALVGRTAADVRDVIVEGESGLLSVCPPWNKPRYEPSRRRITWPNGAIATTYTGDEPNTLRGPQHDLAWCDELAAFRYEETWDNLLMGLRLGNNPRCIVTTTPKNTPLIKRLLDDQTVHVTRGTSFDNRANLPPSFFEQIIKRYEGTRLGRQELYAEILSDSPGALWKRANIENSRVTKIPDLKRIIVAIDPSVTSQEGAAETGIIVAGSAGDEYFVLADSSLRGTPNQWAVAAISAYKLHKADKIVGEANNGGDLIEANLRTVDKNISFKKVHASRGKVIRAEPVASLYEQGRVHHVGYFAELEDQLCSWQPGETSPDRLDALVWALTELSSGGVWTW